MKIQCDVCSREEASVFCIADEAALCSACDRRVHRANKLAGKHRRIFLVASSSSHPHPLCDICQEKQGFVFCKEDRAILCMDCDPPIHAANRLTMNHSRFLLTGARISPEAEAPDNGRRSPAIAGADVSGKGNSISEYLISTIPGWRVEDLLTEDDAGRVGAQKVDGIPPFLEWDLENSWPESWSEGTSMCGPHVPETPISGHPAATLSGSDAASMQCFMGNEVSHDELVDDAVMVPQIYPVSGNNKRLRGS